MTRELGKYGMVITTTANKDDARKIASVLLKARLSACIQTLAIESLYTWKGEVANEPEFLLLVKTKTSLVNEAIDQIKKIHPYETPEIVATDFVAGFGGYFSWIDEVTK